MQAAMSYEKIKSGNSKPHLTTTIGTQGCFDTFAGKLLKTLACSWKALYIKQEKKGKEKDEKETIIPLFIEHKGTLK